MIKLFIIHIMIALFTQGFCRYVSVHTIQCLISWSAHCTVHTVALPRFSPTTPAAVPSAPRADQTRHQPTWKTLRQQSPNKLVNKTISPHSLFKRCVCASDSWLQTITALWCSLYSDRERSVVHGGENKLWLFPPSETLQFVKIQLGAFAQIN